MLWLDLGLGCLLLWGAISGYQAGWKKSAWSLGGLVCALSTALLGMAELRKFWNGYYGVEEALGAIVNSRLALPVSGGAPGTARPDTVIPRFLWEALRGHVIPATTTDWRLLADHLGHLLGCTAAFLAGFCLWWGFFVLCGSALAGTGASVPLGIKERWGGAFIGLIRQCGYAVLLIGMAAPSGWLCGIPADLLRLEQTLLAHSAWQLFACLGIWK